MSEPPNPPVNIAPHEPNLAADIYHSISSTAPDQNVVISPLLLEASLALLYLGSDGATADEIQKLLRLKQRFPSNAKMASYYAAELAKVTGDADTYIELQNHLLMQPNYGSSPGEIAEDFQKIAQTYFHVTSESINMEQTEKLRRHVSEHILASVGGGNWQSTLVESSQAAKLLLLLAANLQSKWFLPFSAYRTGLYEFHSNGCPDSSKSVAMLFDDDMFVKYAELRELNARAIELPYEHAEELSMLLILPNQREGLAKLENQLRGIDMCALQQCMQMEGVQVLLPKFSIDFECSFRQPLKQIGFEKIFLASANFKHLHPSGNLPAADVLQKLRINLNESGSGSEPPRVAAEYKPIVISNSSRQKFFRADHPFFFAIRSENVTYLMGHVVGF
ncbi:serine protease inhibitor 42Dd [Drosophila obscura]|uniref:serine protease inhibitor 42Dd n=1 Tax=Drosophila obscura TaxID=7282 RepID=UPI000BA14536|nr:serine protease inhibitor 42Dd [Drosophila obscura]XP_022222566.1 serine protease inhibitor 42Dd [Drosophila obscura]XP_022222567.1 serine protease inhibitor 42Dd [Drosophila obscura]XP_022222568.1 serine protease inhibitor 42Dd [Drosophila obscura]